MPNIWGGEEEKKRLNFGEGVEGLDLSYIADGSIKMLQP